MRKNVLFLLCLPMWHSTVGKDTKTWRGRNGKIHVLLSGWALNSLIGKRQKRKRIKWGRGGKSIFFFYLSNFLAENLVTKDRLITKMHANLSNLSFLWHESLYKEMKIPSKKVKPNQKMVKHKIFMLDLMKSRKIWWGFPWQSNKDSALSLPRAQVQWYAKLETKILHSSAAKKLI